MPPLATLQRRCGWCLVALLAWAACAAAAPAVAQGLAGEAQTQAEAALDPADVARAFVAGCVQTEGRSAAVVDWALVQGWGPIDPWQEDAARPLLDGAAGHVLVMPGSRGGVLLAVTQDDRCVFWAERLRGPVLRLAVLRELELLSSHGARLKIEVDRNLERAGGWRNLLQWRYRRLGGVREFNIGAVTTLGDAAAAQALNLAPAQPAPVRDPDGLPLR